MGKTVKPKGRTETKEKPLRGKAKKKRTEETESEVAGSEKDMDERK